MPSRFREASMADRVGMGHLIRGKRKGLKTDDL